MKTTILPDNKSTFVSVNFGKEPMKVEWYNSSSSNRIMKVRVMDGNKAFSVMLRETGYADMVIASVYSSFYLGKKN